MPVQGEISLQCDEATSWLTVRKYRSITPCCGEEMDPRGLTDYTSIRPENRHLPISLSLHFLYPLLRQLPLHLPIIQSLQTIQHHQILPWGNSLPLPNAIYDDLRGVLRVHDRIRPPEDQHRAVVERRKEGHWGLTGIRPANVRFIGPNFLGSRCKSLRKPNVERQPDPRGRQNHLKLWHPRSQIDPPRVHPRCRMRKRDRKFFRSDGFRLQIVPEHAL